MCRTVTGRIEYIGLRRLGNIYYLGERGNPYLTEMHGILQNVTVSRDNRVFIMDRENNRCQVFGTDGSYLEEWSDIRGPNDAVVDQNDIMFIGEGWGQF